VTLASREDKQRVRERTWQRLDDEKLAAFPRPIHGRIPNFKGSSLAANRLADLPEFREARAIKVNPDAPQLPVRKLVLEHGKLLLTPTPRLREGFLLLDPAKLDKKDLRQAASIGGAARLAQRVGLDDLPPIDLIVVGTVAVTVSGARVGKGEGYAELEYATLRQLGRINASISLATTVHDVQVVDDIPIEPFDVPVDIVVTPTRLIRTESSHPKPAGILWDLLDPARLDDMPILNELRDRS
jgi:5-formyltetrahydrofolate cyclo-ligase